MRKVNVSNLVPGMITAEDVFNYDNQLIVPKGQILNDKAITKLTFYSVFQVRVEDEVVQEQNPEFNGPSYMEKLSKSPEFVEFKKEFEEDVSNFKNVLNDVVKRGAPLEIDNFMSQTFHVLSADRSLTGIFDMLQCMREYDDETYIHSMNVALICNVFARWLRFDEAEIRLATISGLLHDIGKTQIPDKIIQKPSKLTGLEYNVVKNHPQKGYDMIKDSHFPDCVKNAVLMHHEKCDGSGYPKGLSREQIDPYAKLVAIADVYDAMTSSRIYRGPLCPFKAIALFESEGLQKYDTQFILTFLENIVNSYLLNRVRLNNGVIGKIVYVNKHKWSAPTIQTEHGFLDLSIHPELEIEEII